MARPRVLLTGFGPFPGVAENPSGWLAETLAACPSNRDWDLHAAVLPTEWEAVAALAPHLHERLQPDVMIHFGVSARAKGLRLERSAHNRAASRADAGGRLPDAPAVSAHGLPRLDTRFPVGALAARLRGQGHAASASASCGLYLCNFLYYRSLAWAQARGRDALFVHVPLTRAQGGDLAPDALLDAARETLRFVMGTTANASAALARSDAALAAEARR